MEPLSEYHPFPCSFIQFPDQFSFGESILPAPYNFNGFPEPLIQHPMRSQIQEVSAKSICFSSNSTSDEADEQQLSIIHERKQRRMISNRESARRSRMRKQKHLDELCSQFMFLINENRQLIDKLSRVSERRDQVAQENAQLREEAVELKQMITDLQIKSPFSSLAQRDDHPCNNLA